MKKIIRVLALSLVLFLTFGLVACSSYGKLEKAFTKNGYEVVENTSAVLNQYFTGKDKEKATSVHVLKKTDGLASAVVIIFEFNANDELVDFYKNSSTAQGFVKDVSNLEDVKKSYDALVDAGFVKGNCLVVPITLIGTNEVTNIVKNA